jgi:hypothetical protein
MHPRLQRLKIVGNSLGYSVLDISRPIIFVSISIIFHFFLLNLLLPVTQSRSLNDSLLSKNNINFLYYQDNLDSLAEIPDVNPTQRKEKKIRLNGLKKLKDGVSTAPNNPKREYYYEHEIDEPASLVGELDINVEAWPLGKVVKLNIRLFISENGTVNKWELLSTDDHTDNVSDGLAYFSNSIFNPAKFRDKFVSSIKDIEVVIFRD